MSKQSSELPQISEQQKPVPSKKERNWTLWWLSTWSNKAKWSRWGRYIHKEDAEQVLNQLILRKFTVPGKFKILYKDERP